MLGRLIYGFEKSSGKKGRRHSLPASESGLLRDGRQEVEWGRMDSWFYHHIGVSGVSPRDLHCLLLR